MVSIEKKQSKGVVEDAEEEEEEEEEKVLDALQAIWVDPPCLH